MYTLYDILIFLLQIALHLVVILSHILFTCLYIDVYGKILFHDLLNKINIILALFSIIDARYINTYSLAVKIRWI